MTAVLDRPSTATATPTGVPVAYERISKFRVDRDGISAEVTRPVGRQAKDNEACAELLGLGEIAQHFQDEGLSASQFARKVREDWEALLSYVRSGAASHVLVWLFDRAFRTTEASEALLAACRQGGALIVQTAGSPVVADPHSPDDIFRLKLAGLLAEYEVAKMSMRQRRQQTERARAGVNHGGPRAYGYEPGYVDVRESEALVVRKAARAVAQGQTLHAVARMLNEAGHRTAKGSEWRGQNVGRMLRKPYLAGLRVHQGQVVGNASWQPILDMALWDAVQAVLRKPERRTNEGATARKHLLSGIARCGTCGGRLLVRPNQGGTNPKSPHVVYYCRNTGCGHKVFRRLDLVDRLVVGQVLATLAREDARRLLTAPDSQDEAQGLAARADALEANREALAARFAVGSLPANVLDAGLAAIAAELDEIHAAQAGLVLDANRHRVLDGLAGNPNVGAAWVDLPLDRRRAVVDMLVSVTIFPRPSRSGNSVRDFDPELVQVLPK